MNRKHILLCTSLLALLLLGACKKSTQDPIPPRQNDGHLALGNPSNAQTDEGQPNNYLLAKPQFVLSYNRSRGTANWVSWHLSRNWLGLVDRSNDFRADPDLPAAWDKIGASDYSGSGFDRGHVCPSADRTNTRENNSATFVMTNMIPQAPDNNRGTWASLETYTRSLLDIGDWEIYIIAGGYGIGGRGSNGTANTIAQGRVTVPSNTWKVIVIIPQGDNDAARVSTNTRVIAVDMPNTQGLNSNWRSYRTSVDDIEAKTGLDLLSAVSPAVQGVIEARVDNQ